MQVFKKRSQQHADAGMTLPELLVSVTLTGILATSLALATNVMLSNRDNTMGRGNNARSEQNVGLFMPTDLASSESEDTDPWAVPCGPTAGPDHLLGTGDDIPAPPCPPEALIQGSNALQLTWTSSVVVAGSPVLTTTRVSYRVVLVGTEYQLIRVRCDVIGTGNPTCTTQIVLHDLTPPPVGVTFVPGVTKPDWIITVSKATDPLDTSGASATPVVDPGLKNKNGQRVVVTVNGGGGGSSASGGQSQIFLSAGGTNREASLSTEDLSGAPTFTAARSRCGGNIGMIVDTSNSITNPQLTAIRAGIQSFLDEFAGTPVKLQIVTFSTVGTILGSSVAGEPKWFDMLVDSDVQTLKTLASGIVQNGGTNWEDGFMRMLKNVDGTTPAQMPSKVIFFTDGVPTYDRLAGRTSSTAPAVTDPLDSGLPASTGSVYSQVGWNRAERVIRDRGKVDVIGIFVGTLPTNTVTKQPTSAYQDWTTASAGYHWAWARGNTVVYQKGYHLGYQRNNNIVYERGSHSGYQVGNNVVWERSGHWQYERNNNVVFERSGTGLTYEQWNGSSWTSKSATNYFSNNTTPDSSDNWRVRVTGSLNSWTSTSPTMTQNTHDDTNTTVDQTDGFRTRVNGSLSSSWTTVTAAQYNASNSTGDSTDGWRVTQAYSSPYDTWFGTTQATYDTPGNNSTVDSSDGWRTRQTATSTSWSTVTAAQYNASNSTSDETDGWSNQVYSSPFSTWTSTTQATYETAGNNSTADSTDGWRTRVNGSLGGWTNVTSTQYSGSNTTADNTDGWQTYNVYSTPFDTWESTTQAIYDTAGNNSSPASTDGWRTTTTATPTAWTDVPQAQFDASNTTGSGTVNDDTDGWRVYKAYSAPTTYYDVTTKKTSAIDLLGNVVVGDLTGNTGAYNRVDAPAGGAPYPDNVAAAADVFALPDYTYFAQALDRIVLGECGGTVTLQTKNTADNLGAKDPFTYENTLDRTTVKTSQAFKSGTFDVAFPGENAKTITISPQEFTNLSAWSHVSWSCKSKGAAYPFTETPVPGHTAWTSITLTVHANEAISCTQMVSYLG